MTEQEIVELKENLEAKLAELIDRAEKLENKLREPGDSDWSENAVALENQETLMALEGATEKEIGDIRLALDRIAKGEYGRCSRCQKSIPKARLSVLPWATTCVQCA
ncbi:MAG: TraR/DksA C4-type zinc finger protein [Pirellula sp.]|jgi:RNA polymerase-binding transcription factor DksA|nr:TraR/DksA C4-type zinc finger protein [Pirellula sp.]